MRLLIVPALLLAVAAPLSCGGTAADASTSGAGGAPATSASSSTGTGGAPHAPCAASAGRSFCHLEGPHLAAATLAGATAGEAGIKLAATGLVAGTDVDNIYNGASFFSGSVTTADLDPLLSFDSAVVSWNADTPAGTWILVEASARVGSAWTAWYRMGVWASGGSDITRHSFDGEQDAHGHVATDTIVLDQPADAIRARVTLFSADGKVTPTLRRLSIALADTASQAPPPAAGIAWGTTLDVPQRSQMVFANGGEVWCSPTSTSMVMDYWSQKKGDVAWNVPVPTAAAGTYDAVYAGTGNWPFNVAYAASFGLEGAVGWFHSASDLEPWIAAGVPIVVSARWMAGELDNAPVQSTTGHLLVVVGFEANGDVIVNDPAAASDAEVRRTYKRAQFEHAWVGTSRGVVYEIFPSDVAVPWK